ncbi:hypothetical protein GQ457_18G000950 [Hibiscus cannabinus]
MFMNDPYFYVLWLGFALPKDVMLCDKAILFGCLFPGVFKMESLMIKSTFVLEEGACLLNELSQVFCSNTTIRDCGFLFLGLFACRFVFCLAVFLGPRVHVSYGCCLLFLCFCDRFSCVALLWPLFWSGFGLSATKQFVCGGHDFTFVCFPFC